MFACHVFKGKIYFENQLKRFSPVINRKVSFDLEIIDSFAIEKKAIIHSIIILEKEVYLRVEGLFFSGNYKIPLTFSNKLQARDIYLESIKENPLHVKICFPEVFVLSKRVLNKIEVENQLILTFLR